MPHRDLQDFIADLDNRGQLKRVTVEVDPVLEIAGITDRMSKSSAAGDAPPPPTDPVHGRYGGSALLFENVKGSDIPVAINLFGSYQRMCLALGVTHLEELAQRIETLVKPQMPSSLVDKMKKLPDLARMAGFGPRSVKRGICQQVIHTDDANLFNLPIIQCWPHDGQPGYGAKPPDYTRGTGRYITLGGIITDLPDGSDVNVGMYRVQVFDEKLAAIHWHIHHDGARHFRAYRRENRKMPVAIVLGAEPVFPYASTCPLPPRMSELLFAGFISGKGIEMVRAKTIPLEVPANAEIVIEGWADPHETLIEGPFGDHTGYHSAADHYPALHITAITHRENPVYPTTIVGPPPQEDYYLGKATERIFRPLLRMLVPEVVDYSLPMFGAFHNCVFVKIRKDYPMQARKVISALWGAGQMMLSKMIVVVDDHVDVHNEQDVLFHMCANVDWRRDVTVADGPCDVLDHATPDYGSGAKIGIDATRKIPGEGNVRDWPEELVISESIKELVDKRWREYGF